MLDGNRGPGGPISWLKLGRWSRIVAVSVALTVPLAAHGLTAPSGRSEAGITAPGLTAPSGRSEAAITAPGLTSTLGVGGTTSADLRTFAAEFNAQRTSRGLRLIPLGNFRYDPCMERRLFWIAEDPSANVTSAWGHIGTRRSDGLASVGCDGNLAGGMGDTGTTVAGKWWNSAEHRMSLYKPSYTADTSAVCIYFAMTHGGVPDEPAAFTRAAARWRTC